MRDLVDELLRAEVAARLFGTARWPTLGRLELRRRLGAGAMGTVFAAYDPRLAREVAVKVLHRADRHVIEEARALASVKHPNVVTVHDVDEIDGTAFVVMELVEGGTLRAWVGEPRPWRDVARVIREAASGLAALHTAGLVHRDVKPDNILVGHDRARLGDLGLVDDPRGGTPAYAAPEGTADAASDQYSLGVTAFEALNGARPPAGVRRAPSWLHAAIAKMREHERAARFRSIDDAVVALGGDHRARNVAIAAAVVLGCGLGLLVTSRSGGTRDPCAAGTEQAAVAELAVRAPAIAAAGELATSAQRWATSYRAVCQTTHAPQLLDARLRCLDRAFDRLRALDAALAHQAHAPQSVGELPAANDCETLAVDDARASSPSPAALAAENTLDRAWATFALGRYREAGDLIATLAPPELPRDRAELLALQATIDARTGKASVARDELDRALQAAAAAGAPDIEYDLWMRRMRTELFAGDPAKVLEWESFARAAASHAHRSGAELDGVIGEALRDRGQLRKASELLEHALASPDALRPSQRAVIELNLASVELAAGRAKAAAARLEQTRDQLAAQLGAQHPDLALDDDKLSAAYRALGDPMRALAAAQRGLAIRMHAFDARDRSVASSKVQLALSELELGRLDDAQRDLVAAAEIRTAVYGETSARLGEIEMALGDAAALDPRAAAHAAAEHYATAARLDPRLELTARRVAIGDAIDPSATAPLSDELLSVDRAAALAARPSGALANELRRRLPADYDAPLALAVAAALSAVEDRDGARTVLEPIATSLVGSSLTAWRVRAALALASGDSSFAKSDLALADRLAPLVLPDLAAVQALAARAK